MNNSATQSTAGLTAANRLLKVEKSRQRLEHLLSDGSTLVGNRQRKITGRNYFNANDMASYDDDMIISLCEEVEDRERLELIDVL